MMVRGRPILYFFLYGAALALLVFILKWIEWKFLILNQSLEVYIGLIALFFTLLGIWLANQIAKPKIEKVIVEKVVEIDRPVERDLEALSAFNFTKREEEVLLLVAKGYSNAEIADQLFLSLSTVKTHVSNVLMKMDVKSRSQVIEKANRLKITG